MSHHKNLAYFFLRFVFGINLLTHGLVRFGDNYQPFVDGVKNSFSQIWLPEVLVSIHAHLIPPLEFILGLLLIIGFQTKKVLIGSFLLLSSLVFGMSLLQKWSIVGNQMIYIICLFLLFFFMEYNQISIDQRKKSH